MELNHMSYVPDKLIRDTLQRLYYICTVL